MVGLVRVMPQLKEIGYGSMVPKQGHSFGVERDEGQRLDTKTGQDENQINPEKKTVHNFMPMDQDGTIYHVRVEVSVIM